LSGVFEVGASVMGVAGGTERHGTLGSFFTGMLAVLVATPCTAPFMGVAVAAGLAAPPIVTVAVFITMGLGLAAPYVALASMPWLVRLLPRPGQWMIMLKQILAFPMYGAAAWLAWVVSVEAGPAGVMTTMTGAVLIGFAAWLHGVTQGASTQTRRLGQTACIVAVLAALAVLSRITPAETAPAAGAEAAEAYSAARLAALREQGKPVFVNMTAAWCVTCLVNERVAIATDGVRHAFASGDVTYLKGDWTRQDPAITDFLGHYGRDGVPLYVFFPAHNGQPLILPQILTEGEVLRVLNGGG
jgi:thiol:disulfide interchange protein DsbD